MPPPLPRRRRPGVRSSPHWAVPVAGSLPRNNGGSASASSFSRPARRSLALRPARSLNRPRRPFCIEVLQSMSLPPRTAPIAPGCYVELDEKALTTQHIWRILLNITPLPAACGVDTASAWLTAGSKLLASCAGRSTKASKGAGARTPPRIPRKPLHTVSAALQALPGRGRAVSARAAAPPPRPRRRPDPSSTYVE